MFSRGEVVENPIPKMGQKCLDMPKKTYMGIFDDEDSIATTPKCPRTR